MLMKISNKKFFTKVKLSGLRIIVISVTICFMVLLYSGCSPDIDSELKNEETTASQNTETARVVYVPDPEDLQKIPDIDTLDLLEENINATEKLTLSWKKQDGADYYLLCVLDDINNVIQKEILLADVTEWEITDFGGSQVLLLCYKDKGQDGTEDDVLLNSYILKVASKDDLAQQVLMNAAPEKRYYILVDKEDNSLAILALDENMAYTNVIATFSCALGRSVRMTPSGVFEISSKGVWKSWKSGRFSPYYTRFTSGLYIHGALYTEKEYGSMITEYYEGIGINDTSGCIRTTLEGAKWIYYNCPAGTVIEIVASSDLVERVGKPEIDPDYPTWDPTDPSKPSN